MKKIFLFAFSLLQSLFVFSQNSFPNKNTIIEQEISLNSISVLESSKSQDLEKQGIKVINEKQGNSQFLSIKQFNFKPTKEGTVNLSIETKRIKTKNSQMDIDTDSPFATNEGNKMALDHYMGILEKVIKINYNPTKLESDSIKSIALTNLPVLNPIHELSGVILNHSLPLDVGHAWTDSIYNNDGIFVNIYEVLKKEGKKSTLSLEGKLIAKDEKVEIPPYDHAKHVPGSGLQSKIKIFVMEYSGYLIVDNDNYVIQESKLKTKKEFTIFTPFSTNQRANSMELIIKNRIK